MKRQRSVETSEDLVRAFADLFDEVRPETPEEIDAVLRETGLDPDAVGARMKAAAEQALADSLLNWRNRGQRELASERARFERTVPTAPRSRADIMGAIQQLLAELGGRAKPVYAHFRNLESATEEDLASLLSELEYLASRQRRPGEE